MNKTVKVWPEIQVHFLFDQVTPPPARTGKVEQVPFVSNTHAHTHVHTPLSSSPLLSLAVSKNTFKPISGINFTYSKLIIL